jgi:sugar-specific transcriptional regulator TrmB
MHLTERLMEFGLSRQEASLYLCLLVEGDLNGYELCKSTGISRSNVYTGLAGLVDQGAAWLIEGDSTRYRAVPAAEFTANRLRRLGEFRDCIIAELPSPHSSDGGYVTIKGESAIIDRLRNLILEASERIYLSLEPSLIARVWPELEGQAKAGIKVVAITRATAIPGLRPRSPEMIFHAGEPGTGQIRLIIDSTHVLTGDIKDGPRSSCLYSSHENLVDLFKSALKNEIRLIELGRDPNP